MRSFSLVLPMPPSVNKMHGFADRGKVVFRSKEYMGWIQWAGISWRKQFQYAPSPLMGRLRAQYMFIFTDSRHLISDTFNREKCLSDFLQGKIYGNDSQIDEGQVFKRVHDFGKDRVRIWLTEIEDLRFLPARDNADGEFVP